MAQVEERAEFVVPRGRVTVSGLVLEREGAPPLLAIEHLGPDGALLEAFLVDTATTEVRL